MKSKKFKMGDIVKHKLADEKMVIIQEIGFGWDKVICRRIIKIPVKNVFNLQIDGIRACDTYHDPRLMENVYLEAKFYEEELEKA